MQPQDWTPYFSGHSSTLEALWQTAQTQSPWLKVTPQGIAIDWRKARSMNPDTFRGSTDGDSPSIVALLVDFISWDTLRPDQSNLRDSIIFADVALGKLPVDQNFDFLWQPLLNKIRNFLTELKIRLAANGTRFRHKKFGSFFYLDTYELLLEELWDFPQMEYRLGLKMNLSYLNPWKYASPITQSYQTRSLDGQENFRTATYRNTALINLTNRVSTWLINNAQHSTGRVSSGPEDLATIWPLLSECSRLHWKARVPLRTIETKLETLVYGEIWANSKLFNQIHGMIGKFKNLAQVYELESQDPSLGPLVKSVESDFYKTSDAINFKYQNFFTVKGYGSLYELSLRLNSELAWLVTETPLFALLYSGLFQLYGHNKKSQLIFGFSPLVMSLQCANKLTGSTIFTETTSKETSGPESSLESSSETSAEASLQTSAETPKKTLKSPKTKDLPLDQFSGTQLWSKVNRA